MANPAGQGFANAWISGSSRRWKENIRPIGDALRKINQLQGVYYDWKPENGGKHDLGFIAEDVGKVMPEVVAWEADGEQAKGINYDHLVALTVEGIKEQQKQIQSLQPENATEMRNELTALRRQVAALTAVVEELQKKNSR